MVLISIVIFIGDPYKTPFSKETRKLALRYELCTDGRYCVTQGTWHRASDMRMLVPGCPTRHAPPLVPPPLTTCNFG